MKPVDLPGRGVPSRIIKNRLSSKVGGRTPTGKVHPVPTVVPDLSAVLPAGDAESSLIDRVVREGARRMRTRFPGRFRVGRNAHLTNALTISKMAGKMANLIIAGDLPFG